METKKICYTITLGEDCRRRHFHRCVRKWVTEFTVQLEIFVKYKWHPVVRYDTAHGFAHRDLMHLDGSVEKTDLNIKNINQALIFAENDIKTNWQIYRNMFLEEVKDD